MNLKKTRNFIKLIVQIKRLNVIYLEVLLVKVNMVIRNAFAIQQTFMIPRNPRLIAVKKIILFIQILT